MTGKVGRFLWTLLGAAGLVLFLACAKAANHFLVRAKSRLQELAIRAALGVSRRCIARELVAGECDAGLARRLPASVREGFLGAAA